MSTEVLGAIRQHRIVAILRRVPMERLADTAMAIVRGGVRLLEVTFDQEDPRCERQAAESISLLAGELPPDVLVGAGTVMTPEQAETAAQAGARFILAPNVDGDVIATALKLGLTCIPGALTPSEAASAHKLGAQAVKLFPAGDLGLAYFKSIRAPLSHIPFLAVGAITAENLPGFMKAGAIGAGIGSGIADLKLINQGRFKEIEMVAERYCAIAKGTAI